MPQGIGAAGVMGLALEAAGTPGTYVPPTKFFPFLNESLQKLDAQVWRRPVRATPDAVGVVGGNVNVAGDVVIEAFEDVVPYFLYAARLNVVKSGTTNLTYTFTGSATAIPARTMSITVVRNGIVFGYVGCITSQYSFTTSNGIMQATFSMIGSDEATQSAPTAAWPTTAPFGAGTYSIQVPTATQVFDADNFTFTVNDNAAPQFRLKNTGRGSQFQSYGERDITLTIDRDFLDKTEYAAFVALTSRSITIIASKGVNNSITLTLPAATQTAYPVNIGNQTDLVRASTAYQGAIDGTGNALTITVLCQESIT